MRKTFLQANYKRSIQKTAPKNTLHSRNETILQIGKMATMQRLQPQENGQFGSKNKAHYRRSRQKTAPKNTLYSRNETILKIGKMATMQGLQLLENGQLWSKNEIAYNMRKTFLQAHYRCSMQKNGSKNTHYIRAMRVFSKLEKWQQCNGYSLCKMVSLG